MSDYLLADRAEAAFVSILTTPIRTAMALVTTDPTPLWCGKNYTEIKVPGVGCAADVGDEEVKNTGNFWITATITVKTSAVTQPGQTTTKPGSLALLSAVHNALYVTDLEALLTAAVTQFHVYNDSMQRPGGNRTQEATHWEDTITLRFLACATDLS